MGIDKKCFRIQREGDTCDSNGEAKERVSDGF